MKANATLDGSLCSPEKCPATLEVDPAALQFNASGTPSASVSPTALELPSLMLEDKLVVRVSLPDITLRGTDRLGGIVGALVGTQGNIFDTLVGLFTNSGSLEDIARLEISDLKIEVEPFRANLGRLALHGIPENAQQTRTTFKLDLDALDAQALFNGLKAQLKGCLVLNGGEDPCAGPASPCKDSAPPTPNVCAVPTVIRLENVKSGQTIPIYGTNFGAAPGRVLVMDAAGQRATVIQSWSDSEIRALPSPQIPPGSYFLQVQTAAGLMSAAVALLVS